MHALDSNGLEQEVGLVERARVALEGLGRAVHFLALTQPPEAVQVALVTPQDIVGVKARAAGCGGGLERGRKLNLVVLEVVQYAAWEGSEGRGQARVTHGTGGRLELVGNRTGRRVCATVARRRIAEPRAHRCLAGAQGPCERRL